MRDANERVQGNAQDEDGDCQGGRQGEKPAGPEQASKRQCLSTGTAILVTPVRVDVHGHVIIAAKLLRHLLLEGMPCDDCERVRKSWA